MIKKPVKIQLSEGLDARPIALLVQEASQYSSSVYIEVDQKQVNAKSIMGMMSLTLLPGEEITVVANGTDEKEAAALLERAALAGYSPAQWRLGRHYFNGSCGLKQDGEKAFLLFLKAGKPMNKCQCLIDCCDYNWSLHIVVTVMNRNKVCRMNLHR